MVEPEKVAARVTSDRWWLRGDDGQCTVCEATYVIEAERRCVACDRAFCAHCVVEVRVSSEILCRECEAGEVAEGMAG